jgi:hypothetical protein
VLPFLRPALAVEVPFQASSTLVLLAELGFVQVFLGGSSVLVEDRGLSSTPSYTLSTSPELGQLLIDRTALDRAPPALPGAGAGGGDRGDRIGLRADRDRAQRAEPGTAASGHRRGLNQASALPARKGCPTGMSRSGRWVNSELADARRWHGGVATPGSRSIASSDRGIIRYTVRTQGCRAGSCVSDETPA